MILGKFHIWKDLNIKMQLNKTQCTTRGIRHVGVFRVLVVVTRIYI